MHLDAPSTASDGLTNVWVLDAIDGCTTRTATVDGVLTALCRDCYWKMPLRSSPRVRQSVEVSSPFAHRNARAADAPR